MLLITIASIFPKSLILPHVQCLYSIPCISLFVFVPQCAYFPSLMIPLLNFENILLLYCQVINKKKLEASEKKNRNRYDIEIWKTLLNIYFFSS